MKKIIAYLVDHLKKDFNLTVYLGCIVLIATGIYVRYGLKVDTYFFRQDYRFIKGALFYSIPYFGSIVLIVAIKREWNIFSSRSFWLITLAVLAVVTINQYGLIYKAFVRTLHSPLYVFYNKLGFNLFTAFIYLAIPSLYYLLNREKGSFYGFTLKGFDYRPYAWMLLCLLPLLIWASFQPSFLKAYPRYIPGNAEDLLAIPYWQTVVPYELSYVLQFIGLELFFRGFMIMKLEKHLGTSAILPMACVYTFIHFGKPMPETMSSFFGGFLLGVIALRTRSVFGGACIHIGIALLMELLAFLQR